MADTTSRPAQLAVPSLDFMASHREADIALSRCSRELRIDAICPQLNASSLHAGADALRTLVAFGATAH